MKHLIIGTAGHIDHGKTSLIRMLTGIDCDTHKEEKQRGITINLGFSYLNLPGGESFGIIDVPGHKDFINTMIGGACGIDMVLLVIAADSGIMPQTHEHMNIIDALGIKNGVVALTKSDLVDDELLEIATFEISDFLSKSSLQHAPIIPVSSLSGKGSDELKAAIAAVAAGIQPRETGKLFRMYVDRIFTVKGFGSVVTGSVMSGRLDIGQDVFLLPGNNQKLRVRSIERHGQAVESVVAGDRAAINLIGLKREEFGRGMIISDKPLEPTSMIDAAVRLFDTETTLTTWSGISFIAGTFECQGRMHLLNRDSIGANEEAIVQIHLGKPAMLLNKDKFIIRNSSEEVTLGGGFVLEAFPLHHRKRTPKLIDELNRLLQNITNENSVREMIHQALKKEFRPFFPDEIAERLNLGIGEILATADNAGSGFISYSSAQNTILINGDYDATFRNKILQALREFHSKNPFFATGPETGELSGKMGLSKSATAKSYLDLLLQRLQHEGYIEKSGNTWIVKGHRPQFDKQSLAEIAWVEQMILDYGENKPSPTEIEERATARNIPKQKIKAYLTYLAGQNKIRFFKSDLIHSQIFEKYRNHLLSELAGRESGMEIMAFKESLGTKKLRALIIQMLEADGLISMETGTEVETKLFITEKGEKAL